MSSPRNKAVFKAVDATPVVPSSQEEKSHEAGEIFGRNVFGLAVMRKRLPKDVYRKLAKTIRDGERLWGWVTAYDLPLTVDDGPMRVDLGVQP